MYISVNFLSSSNLCLSVRSYLMNPLTDLSQIFRELGRTTGMFLAWL